MPDNIWKRVGIEAEDRLRWLVRFGQLDLGSMTEKQRETIRLEVAAFLALQEVDPALRVKLRWFPQPIGSPPGLLSQADIRRVHSWLRKGLVRLRNREPWAFTPHVGYQLEAYRGLLFARLAARSSVEKFKALAYHAFSDARLRFRLCQECRRPFVPVRRQAYCSPACSQARRTRKWRSMHRDKVRQMRRDQYKRSRRESAEIRKLAGG